MNTEKNFFLRISVILLAGFLYVVTPQSAYAEVSAVAQQNKITVTGVIRDAAGEPVFGASVVEKGTTNGVPTDKDGKYSIKVAPDATITYSCVGFQQVTVPAKGRVSINVSMVEDSKALNEVVVEVGYTGVKRAHLTGSVVSMRAEEIEDLPLGNLGSALVGRMAGLSVTGGTTRPGSAASLVIRNPTTWSKDGGVNDPLYVIDGVVQVDAYTLNPDATAFNNLDPSEVESINVLKDGAAAIYGSRAANGVILVRTKRGQLGKPRISFSSSYGVNDEMYRSKMLSALEYAQYMNIVNGPNGRNQTTHANLFPEDELAAFANLNYDWLDEAWSSSYMLRNTVNVSGGHENVTYFAGLSQYNQNGNLASLDYSKYTWRAGADIKMTAGLKVGLQVSGDYSNKIKTFNKIGGENDENDYKTLIETPRYIPPYVNGMAVYNSGIVSGYHYYEIQKLNNKSEAKDFGSTMNLNVEWEVPFIDGLKARWDYSRSLTSSEGSQVGTKYNVYTFNMLGSKNHLYELDGQYATMKSMTTLKNGNRLYYSDGWGDNYQTNAMLSYDKTFGGHQIAAFASFEQSETFYKKKVVYREDPIQNTYGGMFATATGAVSGSTEGKESATQSYMGRINYNYMSKYLFEYLLRVDASTKFSPENYWGDFHSVSAGWVVSEEDFFSSNWIDNLKFRASVGLLGSDNTKAWGWRQRFTFQQGKGSVYGTGGETASTSNSTMGMKMELSPNPDVRWDNSTKTNFGVDASFLNSRLSTTIDAFYNHQYNMLMSLTNNIPVTVGGSLSSVNYGIRDAYGAELSLDWRDKIGSEFRYQIRGYVSWADDKVIKKDFSDNIEMWEAHPDASSDYGQWGYDCLGLLKTQEDINAYVAQYGITKLLGTNAESIKPGMLSYKDVRGPQQEDGTYAAPDGVIDGNDVIQLTKKSSSHIGFGLTLNAAWRNLKFETTISGSAGGFAEIDGRTANDGSKYINVPSYWRDIYDPELNPEGSLPNPYYSSVNTSPVSNFWQVSSFRLRMRNFQLNYSLPKSVSDYLKISGARVYVSGTNPLNFYNPFDYKDSEGSYNSYPNLRTISFGLGLTI